jgi:RNA polymerase sigma-70 factor (ECF subfamily)
MDHDLVLRAQRGDQGAFETLVSQHYTRLQKTAIGILRDRHVAEDATQQACLDIWRDIRRLRDPARFEGWSYRLLVRVCYAESRRAPKWAPETEMRTSDEPLAADAFGAVVDRDQLERAFAQLSVDHRTVIVLHHLMDMTLEQVAETLEIPRGTVYSRLSRAMEALRAAMQADGRPATRLPAQREVVS